MCWILEYSHFLRFAEMPILVWRTQILILESLLLTLFSKCWVNNISWCDMACDVLLWPSSSRSPCPVENLKLMKWLVVHHNNCLISTYSFIHNLLTLFYTQQNPRTFLFILFIFFLLIYNYSLLFLSNSFLDKRRIFISIKERIL